MAETPRQTIERIIGSCVYGQLATVAADAGPAARVRPVCAFLQEDLSILVPSHRETRKIAEIAGCPEVEICFVDAAHWQVRAQGRAELVEDLEVKRQLMETTLSPKLWQGFFREGPSDPRFVLYRIRPRTFEWMKEWELHYRRLSVEELRGS